MGAGRAGRLDRFNAATVLRETCGVLAAPRPTAASPRAARAPLRDRFGMWHVACLPARMATSRKSAVPVSEHKAGDLVGEKYRLLREAGEGAMGTVWVALNTALECEVAIKLIRAEVRLPVMATRLLREARAAAKLSHPAIVRVFDLGQTSQGDPYIVMELIEGESLADLLEREKQLAPERAVQIILPVVSGMRAAHDRGIIHRDLKPANIVLARCDDGYRQPKVIDFGIAKLRSPREMNTTGSFLLGTPQYMSPEQAAGGVPVDHRTDIWSLCAMLYELLADGALWQIVERGLRKNPDERWETMSDLYAALAEWLTARGVLEDASGAAL